MQAGVAHEAPFDQGRRLLKDLADLEVTTKSVERTAEAIGADIAAREQQEIGRAGQLDLPIVVAKPVPVLYIELDGTGVPVVKKRDGGPTGQDRGPSGSHQVGQTGRRVRANQM